MTLMMGVVVGVLLSLSMATVNSQRVLCGKTLADTLDLVCANRGFYFTKRSADDGAGKETNLAAKDSPSPRAKRTVGRGGNSGGFRSVVDECCRRPCTYSVLESYCAPADYVTETANQEDRLQEDLQRILDGRRPTTLASTLYTTTQSTAHVDSNSPSAEVFRGPSRGAFPQNGRSFFYVQLGNVRPTRNPLISE
ncbi:uncharacterized protein LOC143298229 isoform X2 [Babylonia areolata]